MFRTLGMRTWNGKQLYVASAARVFDEEGKLVDETVKRHLSAFLEGFAGFVTSC